MSTMCKCWSHHQSITINTILIGRLVNHFIAHYLYQFASAFWILMLRVRSWTLAAILPLYSILGLSDKVKTLTSASNMNPEFIQKYFHLSCKKLLTWMYLMIYFLIIKQLKGYKKACSGIFPRHPDFHYPRQRWKIETFSIHEIKKNAAKSADGFLPVSWFWIW